MANPSTDSTIGLIDLQEPITFIHKDAVPQTIPIEKLVVGESYTLLHYNAHEDYRRFKYKFEVTVLEGVAEENGLVTDFVKVQLKGNKEAKPRIKRWSVDEKRHVFRYRLS